MIEIRTIDAQHKEDINIPNEPFCLFGKMFPEYNGKDWKYQILPYPSDCVTEMCFPDENYNYDFMSGSVFIGAYDGDECIGLAVLKPGFFKYMYLYDLKVNVKYRRQHVGKKLIQKAKQVAAERGYSGLYTQCQDNNPGACLFYLNSGFYIGGIDNNIYRHTAQEGKIDIVFYCESGK